MEETIQEKPQKDLPFNNLYLISGMVHGYNKAWMYLFTVSFLILGYVSFQLVILFPLTSRLIQKGFSESDIMRNQSLIFDSTALGVDRNLVFLLELCMFLFAFVGFVIGLKYVHHKSLTSVLTAYQKFRHKRFWFAFAVWGALLVTGVLLAYIFSPDDLMVTFDAGGILVSMMIMLALMPIQTGLEEVVFRGYLVQGLSQIFKNGLVPLVLTSLLFALAHMTNPEVKEFGWKLMFTYYSAFALFMGGLTLLDEGLELAFGIHFANNTISSILVSAPHSVVKTYSIFEARTENPSTEIIIWLIMAIVTFLIFRYKYGLKNFSLLLK